MHFTGTVERSEEKGTCPRCNGSLVLEDMSDIEVIVGKELCFGLRCLNCGSVLDPLMHCVE